MACLYMLLWIASRSPSMGTAEAFVRVSYPVLLACVASYALRPFVGMVLLYLNTFHVAGLLGYTVAERQRWGWDDTCNYQFRLNPRRLKEEGEDEKADDEPGQCDKERARFAGILCCLRIWCPS